MGGARAKQRESAKKTLRGLFEKPEDVWVIHYSCESFYDRTDGRSPRITSIALRKLDSAQTTSFSIHQVAERQRLELEQVSDSYDRLERQMLDEFYRYVEGYRDRGMKYLHWNMRDVNFGFQALEHRARVHGIEPYVIPDADKSDLSRLLIDMYGLGYIGHPRLVNLLEKNKIQTLDFLTGGDEARAFERQDYVSLHRSTLRKVDVLANIAGRADANALKTNARWREIHGSTVRALLEWVAIHPAWTVGTGVLTLVGVGLGWLARS